MLTPFAEQLKGRAIIAVCDLSENPALVRRENVEAGTMVLYRHGREVARSDGETRAAFHVEMQALGMSFGG